MSVDHERMKEILADAVALATPQGRSVYLDAACGDDAELRAEVERLLKSHEQAGDFLEEPVFPPADEPSDEGPGSVIDRYKLLERIGEGGMGVVYRAEQTEPVRREVALKVIKPGMSTREVVARFETERQALALMDHPHIAHMFDAGATESGRPYFVMELVKGIPITDYCDRSKLKVPERLDLFQQVCEAIQHAHQKGIIHRDIKPSNVLVTLQDGVPFPKVIDFGIAKATQQQLTERTLFTRSGQMIGTPEYMSPEQAEMSNLDVDTRSDVYSLGVLLYELLTGGPPFEPAKLREAGMNEVCRIIRDVEPPKPSTRISTLGVGLQLVAARRSTGPKKLGGMVRGELDWVVMKTLEKDRTRRYETVSSLGADIRHYLSGEPVNAGPPTAFYKLNKLVRRHKRAIAAVVLVLVTLVAGVITTSWQAVRATRAERHAEEDAAIAKAVNEFISQDLLSQADPSAEPNRDVKLREVLDRAAAKVGGRFKDQPLVEAAIRMTLGRTYLGLGEYTTAETHTRRAVEIRRRVLGEEHLDTLTALHNLGAVYSYQSRYAEAEELDLRVLKFRKKVLGEEHPDTIMALHSLGVVYSYQSHDSRAEELFLKVVETQKKVLGEEHPDTLKSLDNLANLYQEQGRYTEAEDLGLKVLELRKKVLSEEHPDTIRSLHHLAYVYLRQVRYDEAEELFLRALEIRKRVLGEEHPDTIRALLNLGVVYLNQSRYHEAEELFLKLLETQKKVLGEEHPGTLTTLRNLGCVCLNQGRYAEAEDLYLKVIEIQERVLGEEHPKTLQSLCKLAWVYQDQSRYAEAEELDLKVLEIQKRVLGEEHPHTLETIGRLASTLLKQGKMPEAQRLYEDLAAKRSRVQGREHPDTLGARHNLAWTLLKQGKLAEARDIYEELLVVSRRVFGPEHLDTLHEMEDLALAIRDQRNWEDLQELYEEFLPLQRKVLGPENPRTLSTMNELAKALHKQGKDAEARQVWEELLEIQRQAKGLSHPETVRTENNLAGFDEAEKIRLILQRGWDAARAQHWPEAAKAYAEVLEHPGFEYGKYERERRPYTMGLRRPMAIAFVKAGDHAGYEKVCRLLLSVVNPERPSVNFSQQFFLDGGRLPEELQQRALELGRTAVVYWTGRPYPEAKFCACLSAGIAEYHAGDAEEAVELLEQAEDHPRIGGRGSAMVYHAMAQKKLDRDDEAAELLERAESLLAEPLKDKSNAAGQDWLDLEACELALEQARQLIGRDIGLPAPVEDEDQQGATDEQEPTPGEHQWKLGNSTFGDKNDGEAVKWYRKAAEQ